MLETAVKSSNGETGLLLRQHLSQLMVSFSKLLKEEGVDVPVDSDRAWTHFMSLDASIQTLISKSFERYFEVMKDISSQGIKLNDTTQSLWRIFRNNEWIPESDLFSRISESDVVEIYMPDNTQLYRNSKYFK